MVAVTFRNEPVYRPVIGGFLAVFRLLRLRFVVQGSENIPASGGAVLASSHLGYLEFALVGSVAWRERRRLLRFLAVKAAFSHRLSGPLMRGMHHIPVDREAGAAAYDAALIALRGGELIGVFPEGGVSRSWTLKSFRTGAARLAAAAEVPIVPVVVWGGHRILTKGRRPHLRDAYRATISITFGEPMIVEPGSDPGAVTEELHASMAALLDAAQRSYPDTPRTAHDRWWLPAHLGGGAPPPAADLPAVIRKSVR
jgi:1-acyl-sn-glycerol-3-phosphate acyltransferase